VTNILFLGLVGHGEGTSASGKALGIRDAMTLLLVIEIVFLFAPAAHHGDEKWWKPEHRASALVNAGQHRWFLLVCLWGKLYVVLLSKLKMPPWLQSLLALLAVLFLEGSLFTVCVSSLTEVSFSSLLANLFTITNNGCAFSERPESYLSGERHHCVSLLSFSTSHGVVRPETYVNFHLILLYVLSFHYSPSLVRTVARHVGGALGWLRRQVEARASAQQANIVTVGKVAVCLLALLAGFELSLVWLNSSPCYRSLGMVEPMHFDEANQLRFDAAVAEARHISLQEGNHSLLGGNGTYFGGFVFEQGEHYTSSVNYELLGCPPLDVSLPTFFRSNVSIHDFSKLKQSPTHGPGILCWIGNNFVDVASIVLISIGLVMLPLHLRLAGSTTLSAYVFQWFFIYPLVENAWYKDLRHSLGMGPGSPFEGLLDLLVCLIYVHTLAPLLQWGVILPQSRLLVWLAAQAQRLYEVTIGPPLGRCWRQTAEVSAPAIQRCLRTFTRSASAKREAGPLLGAK